MITRKYEVRQRGMTKGTVYKVVGLAMVNPLTKYIVTYATMPMARYGLKVFKGFIIDQGLQGLSISMRGNKITVTSKFRGVVHCGECGTIHEASIHEFENRDIRFDEQVSQLPQTTNPKFNYNLDEIDY